jgi:hypothetical protein
MTLSLLLLGWHLLHLAEVARRLMVKNRPKTPTPQVGSPCAIETAKPTATVCAHPMLFVAAEKTT